MDISVYMPVYNGEKYIKRCLDSVLSQEFSGSFEFIIVDDGSEDNTIKMIEEYNDERIKLFKQPHKGIVDASNYGIEQCTGKYIARMDCDDVMLPNSLQLRYDFLESHPEYGVCSGDALIINGKHRFLKLNGREFEIKLNRLFRFYPFTHSNFMYRSELNLRYDKAYEWGEDTELYFRLLYNGIRAYSLKETLCEYYVNNDSVSVRLAKHNINMVNKVKGEYLMKVLKDNSVKLGFKK